MTDPLDTDAAKVREIEALLDDYDAGILTPGGCIYHIHRAIRDSAPAGYRQPLTTNRPSSGPRVLP